MVKKIALACCLPLFFAACASEVKRLKETEYLRTQPGKPLVYPDGLDRPTQEKTYVIPELPKTSSQAATQPPELLALPPRLSGVELAGDDSDEQEQSGDSGTGSEGKSVDEGFIGTPIP
jgi:uncharacterized lipoprotein